MLGTDGNTPWAPHQEMESHGHGRHDADAGHRCRDRPRGRVPPVHRHPAALLAGKNAELIVLDANPLDNITNTRRINAVYYRSQMVNRSAYPN